MKTGSLSLLEASGLVEGLLDAVVTFFVSLCLAK
jgi:hypothetical protein